MRVTFDSNTWEKVAAPEEYLDEPKISAFRRVNLALRNGELRGFICETFATLEAIRKGSRAAYLDKRSQDAVTVDWGASDLSEQSGNDKLRGTLRFGGTSRAHPGLHPIPARRLKQALELGILLVPTSRLGTARPPEIDDEKYRIPLTPDQSANIWDFLQTISEISQAIEERGVGFSLVQRVAERIQRRELLTSIPWYTGLERPADIAESREIDRAFAEWADGDTVAVHIAYGLDILCTEDQGKSAGLSIFDTDNREWLKQYYATDIVGIENLAKRLA